MEILRGVDAEIGVVFTDALGEPTAVTGLSVEVTRDSDGSAIDVGTPEPVDGQVGSYVASIDAGETPEVDRLTAVWTAGGQSITTEVEVVGGFLCTLAEIAEAAEVDDEPKKLAEAREWASSWLEEACGVAFRPKYARDALRGSGTAELLLAHPMPSVIFASSINDQTLDEVLSLDASGVVLRNGRWTHGARTSVAYQHGYSKTPPIVSRAAVKLARRYLIEDPTDLDERATSMSSGDGTYSLVTPGVRGALTSIPEVNAVIDHFAYAQGVA